MFPTSTIETGWEPWEGWSPDFAIPEHRLCIAMANRVDADTEDRLAAIDWRLIVLPSGAASNNLSIHAANTIRNTIISSLNTVDILEESNGSIQYPQMSGDAGWDLVTCESTVCQPGQTADVPTGLKLALPNHLYGVVQARSSTSKKSLIVLPGVIDAGYRGEIFAMVYNLSDLPVTIKQGSRVAQLLFFNRVQGVNLRLTSKLRPSERGGWGFGSTG